MRIFLALLLAVASACAQHPRDAEIRDPDTKAWWHTTEALSGDAMEGRDTGSAAYQRAAEYVAKRFQAAGLKPGGEHGSYMQAVPMHQVQVERKGTSFRVVRESGASVPLEFLQQITVSASDDLTAIDTPLSFRGYCGKEVMSGVSGKVAICFGTQRQGLPGAAERVANARAAGARAVVNVDDPYFTIEPPRWPYAYARSVTLASANPEPRGSVPVMRISAEAFPLLIGGANQDPAAILAAGGRKAALALL